MKRFVSVKKRVEKGIENKTKQEMKNTIKWKPRVVEGENDGMNVVLRYCWYTKM